MRLFSSAVSFLPTTVDVVVVVVVSSLAAAGAGACAVLAFRTGRLAFPASAATSCSSLSFTSLVQLRMSNLASSSTLSITFLASGPKGSIFALSAPSTIMRALMAFAVGSNPSCLMYLSMRCSFLTSVKALISSNVILSNSTFSSFDGTIRDAVCSTWLLIGVGTGACGTPPGVADIMTNEVQEL